MTAFNQLVHLPEEERQNQRADVRTVYIRIGQDNNAMVSKLRCIEIVFADAGSKRSNHRSDFSIGQHLVEASLFYVQDFSLQRKDRLEFTVAPLLCRSTCRFTFHQVQLALRWIAFLAIGKLAR